MEAESVIEKQTCKAMMVEAGLLRARPLQWGDRGRDRASYRKAKKRDHGQKSDDKRGVKPDLMYLDKLARKSMTKKSQRQKKNHRNLKAW